jgi:hypothetical protein
MNKDYMISNTPAFNKYAFVVGRAYSIRTANSWIVQNKLFDLETTNELFGSPYGIGDAVKRSFEKGVHAIFKRLDHHNTEAVFITYTSFGSIDTAEKIYEFRIAADDYMSTADDSDYGIDITAMIDPSITVICKEE